MAIIETVTKSRFIDWFKVKNPLRENQFSYEALDFLYDYLSEQEEDIEFDPIAVCCEFTEYKNTYEFKKEFGALAELEDYAICTNPVIVRNQ